MGRKWLGLVVVAGCAPGTGDGDKEGSDTDGGAAPTCEVTAPADGALLGVGAELVLEATVADADDGVDGLLVGWSSSVDGYLGSGEREGATARLTTDALTAGAHVVTLTATDAAGNACTDSVSVVVGEPPVLTLEAPGQDAVVTLGAATRLTVRVDDPDGETTDVQVVFTSDVDGALGTTAPGEDGLATLGLSSLSRGAHTWTATATDADGFVRTLDARLVVDGAPTGLTVAVEPASPVSGDALALVVLTPAVDPEGATVTTKTTWQRNGVAFLLGASVPAGVVRAGEVWTVLVTASDGDRSAPPATAAVTVGNGRPRVSGVTLSPSTPVGGDTLVATATVVDPEDDAVTTTYTFETDTGALVQQGTSASLVGVTRGQQLRVRVSAADATGPGEEAVSGLVQVRNAAPSATGAVITPSTPSSADTLTCAITGFQDPDEDADQSTYAWSADGGVWKALGASVPPGTFKGGDSVTCQATPSDGSALGDPTTSSPVQVANSRPVLVAGTLSLPSPSKIDTVCLAGAQTRDWDGDSVTIDHAWTAGGRPLGNLSCTALLGAARGETLQLVATPRDGGGAGEPLVLSATLANAPPVVSRLLLDPAAPQTGDDLVLDLAYTEADGDTVDVVVSFVVDDEVVQLGPDLSWPGPVSRGERVQVDLSLDDRNGASILRSTEEVVVGNRPPDGGVAVLSPASPAPGEAVTCVLDVAPTDAELDPLTTTVRWEVDGSPYEGATTTTTLEGDTLPASTTQGGEAWTCVVTTSDGTDEVEVTATVDLTSL